MRFHYRHWSFSLSAEIVGDWTTKTSVTWNLNKYISIPLHFGIDIFQVSSRRPREKISGYRNHLWFSLRCGQHQVVPDSLRLGSTVKRHGAERIRRKVQEISPRPVAWFSTENLSSYIFVFQPSCSPRQHPHFLACSSLLVPPLYSAAPLRVPSHGLSLSHLHTIRVYGC